MSKKGNGGEFNNLAARRFKRPDKIDTMSQGEIFDILDEDIGTIMSQLIAFRAHRGPMPNYLTNAFANLSTSLWFYRYVDTHVKVKKKKGKIKTDLSPEEIDALMFILADTYRKSAMNVFAQQGQEFPDREKLLSKAYAKMDPKQMKRIKKLGLTKSKSRELAIQVFSDPIYTIRYVCRLFDSSKSDLSDKKKLKLFQKLYGERFPDALGAAMTVSKNDSDCISMLFEHLRSSKKKYRAIYLLKYAEAYKVNKSSNFRMSDPKFYAKNKKFFRALGDLDIGFKKSYKGLKPRRADDMKQAHLDVRRDKDKPQKPDRK